MPMGFVQAIFSFDVGQDFRVAGRVRWWVARAKRIMKKETVIKTSRVGIASPVDV